MKTSSSNEEISELEFFKETYKLLYTNLKKFKYRVKNHKFEQTPKKLLTAFLLYKSGKGEEVLELIEGLTEENSFYKGVQFSLIGLAKNHIGKYAFAEEAFLKSVQEFEQIKEDFFIKTSLIGLAFVYGNKKQTKEMGQIISKLEAYSAESDREELAKNHCICLYKTLNEEYKEAEKIVLSVLDDESELAQLYKPSFFVILFCIYFEQSLFELCEQTLERYKMCKGFTIKPNYKYMKTLLNHLLHNKKLYVYERDFSSTIELYHQLMVVKNKAEGSIEDAKKYWDILNKHNPELYGDNFEYYGGASLFNACLNKYLYKETPIFDVLEVDKLGSPIDKLAYIFEQTNAPIDKYLLIELIWDEFPSESSLSKLRKLITSYRRKYGKEVTSIHNSYRIEESSEVAS